MNILADALIKLENEPLPGSLEGLSAVMFDEVSKHMPFGYRFLFANRWLFGGLLDSQMSSTPLINAMIRTTTAPTMLNGSIKSNVLPIEATALINFRLHPRDSIESVTEHVRRVVGSDQVEVRTLGGMEASGVSSWESPGYEIISSSLSKVYGEVVSVPGIMIAASDTRHYSKVADNSFRFNPFSIVPEDMTGFHGTNESIAVDSFIAGIKTYVEIINEGSKQLISMEASSLALKVYLILGFELAVLYGCIFLIIQKCKNAFYTKTTFLGIAFVEAVNQNRQTDITIVSNKFTDHFFFFFILFAIFSLWTAAAVIVFSSSFIQIVFMTLSAICYGSLIGFIVIDMDENDGITGLKLASLTTVAMFIVAAVTGINFANPIFVMIVAAFDLYFTFIRALLYV